MKKIILFITLVLSTGLVFAKPVKVQVSYNNIHSLSNKLSSKQCRMLIKNSTFTFDQMNPVSFKASKEHTVKNSHTVIKTMDGKDQVLVKLGKSIIHLAKGSVTVNRISYVKIKPNNDATGKLVLENLCSADFSSTRA